jgi:hypothetical protein
MLTSDGVVRSADCLQTAIVYIMVGILGLATYIFTAVFVYMSEKDLEHYVSDAAIQETLTTDAYDHTHKSPPMLPNIARTSGGSKDSVSFEQFRENGFVEIDLERQTGTETIKMTEDSGLKEKKKTKFMLFN